MITTRRVKGVKQYHVHKSVFAAIERYVEVCEAIREDCPPALEHATRARDAAVALTGMLAALNERHKQNGKEDRDAVPNPAAGEPAGDDQPERRADRD